MQEEQLRIRGSPDAPVTGENVGLMTYTRQVVKEVLRYRPPAPMVPQVRSPCIAGPGSDHWVAHSSGESSESGTW